MARQEDKTTNQQTTELFYSPPVPRQASRPALLLTVPPAPLEASRSPLDATAAQAAQAETPQRTETAQREDTTTNQWTTDVFSSRH